jgi:hypothetical protein
MSKEIKNAMLSFLNVALWSERQTRYIVFEGTITSNHGNEFNYQKVNYKINLMKL